MFLCICAFLLFVCACREYHGRFLRVYQYQIEQHAADMLVESAAEQQALNRSVRALTRTSMAMGSAAAAAAADNGASMLIEAHIESMKRFDHRQCLHILLTL